MWAQVVYLEPGPRMQSSACGTGKRKARTAGTREQLSLWTARTPSHGKQRKGPGIFPPEDRLGHWPTIPFPPRLRAASRAVLSLCFCPSLCTDREDAGAWTDACSRRQTPHACWLRAGHGRGAVRRRCAEVGLASGTPPRALPAAAPLSFSFPQNYVCLPSGQR